MQTLRVSYKSSKLLKFNFADSSDAAINLALATEIKFAIKEGLVAGLAAILTKTLTGGTLAVNAGNVELTITDPNWALLPPGEYVADFYIQQVGKNIRSEPFMLVVAPVVTEV